MIVSLTACLSNVVESWVNFTFHWNFHKSQGVQDESGPLQNEEEDIFVQK